MGDSNTRRNFAELFCATLENGLKRAHDAQLLIFNALHCFEEEDRMGDERFSKTLEKLTNFRETGDPLTEFFKIFRIIHKQQKSMLKKLLIKKKRIDEKLKSIRIWEKVSNMILVATFGAILIYSIMTAAMVAPPAAAALVAAAAFPMDSVGKWINSLWKIYENTQKKQEEMITKMQAGTFVALMDLDTIRIFIDHLEEQTKSLLEKADFVIEEGAKAVKPGMADIKKMLGDFTKGVEELEKQANMCFRGF